MVRQKKLSCAVIGVGGFGKHYVRLLRDNKRAILSAIASPGVHERGLIVGKETKLYTDAKNIFADPSIEVVIIATPLTTHEAMTVDALRAGKHVLLEKPFVADLAAGERVEKEVEKSKKVFMIGHQYLYNDHILWLKAELEKKRIGHVRYVYAEQLYSGPLRFDVGCFIEAATHEVAIIDHLFSPGPAVEVTGSAIDLAGGKREDFAAATIRYENGLLAHIVVSQYSPIKSRRIIIGGDNGMALFDDQATKDKVVFTLRPFPKDAKLHQDSSIPVPEGKRIVANVLEAREPLAQEIEHFFDSITNGTTPRSDITHAMRVTRVLNKAVKTFML